jgi:osmotically-inducible protein OsmY
MKTNNELKKNLLTQLESKLGTNAKNIRITVINGIVTLEGSISSYLDKWTAIKTVKSVDGVLAISDDMAIRLPKACCCADAEITNAAINAITVFPKNTFKVTVQCGWLFLMGIAENWHQREAVEDAVRHLTGVMGITNLISITPTRMPLHTFGSVHST